MKPFRYSIFRIPYSTSGETLIEVLISVSLLTLISATASGLFISSRHNTAIDRNELLANSLSREGVEAVNKMKNTNFLKFSQKASECWNTKPQHNDLNTCHVAENKIAEESVAVRRFRLTKNPETLAEDLSESNAQLSDSTSGIAASGDIEEYRVRQDAATAVNPECIGPGVPADCSFHTSIYFTPPDGTGFDDRGEISPFYRQIEIQYLDTDADGAADPDMRVVSLVQYRSGTRLRQVKRVLRISNRPNQ